MEIPEELKYLTPYIQRGQELDSREPIVAYYAYYYAVNLAISRGPSNKTTNGYLSHLLDSLEQKKQALGTDNETINDDLVGYAHVENFALKVFTSADNEDCSGHASKKTAKTFLAASVFLELLKTFGELDPEVDGKIKYAKWKAADISKAIREGREPTPGAPGEQQQHDEATTPTLPTTTIKIPETDDASLRPPPPLPAISDFPSPPSNFTAPLASSSPSKPANGTMSNISSSSSSSQAASPSEASSPTVPSATTTTVISSSQTPPDLSVSSPSPSVSARTSSAPPPPPPQQQLHHKRATPPLTSPPPPPPSPPTTHIISTVGSVQIAAAQKNAKWAISALNYDDIKTARTQLLDALNDLGYNMQNNFGY